MCFHALGGAGLKLMLGADVSRHHPRNGRVGPARADEAHGRDAGAGGGADMNSCVLCTANCHESDEALTALGAAPSDGFFIQVLHSTKRKGRGRGGWQCMCEKGKKFRAFGGRFSIWGYDKGEIEAMSSNHQQAAFSEGRQAGENKECRGCGVN